MGLKSLRKDKEMQLWGQKQTKTCIKTDDLSRKCEEKCVLTEMTPPLENTICYRGGLNPKSYLACLKTYFRQFKQLVTMITTTLILHL